VLVGLVLPGAVAFGAAGVEELPLPGCQRAGSPVSELERRVKPCPAVEGTGVAGEVFPARRRLAQLTERHEFLAVVLQPAAQSGPFAQQRLVGDLDGRRAGLGMPVEGQQPGLGPHLDDVDHLARRRAGGGRELGAQGAAPGVFALGADHDQPFEQASHAVAGGVVERAVQVLGTGGDGGVDAAQLAVGGEGEVAIGAAFG
jgi:hypothetical protein